LLKKALPGVGYDPFVEVELQPLYLFDKRLSNKNVVVVENPDPDCKEDDKFIEAGIVSDDYQLITNVTVCASIADILTSANIGFEPGRRMFDGKRYSQRWIFNDEEYLLEPRTGDFVAIGIECFNSYDGSKPAGWSFFAERIDSSAGMVIDWLVGEFRFRHLSDSKWDEELAYFGKRVKDVMTMETVGDFLTAMEAMTDRLSANGLLMCLRNVPASAPLMVVTVKNIERSTSAVSKWEVYNGFMSELAQKPSFANDKKNREITQYFIKSPLQSPGEDSIEVISIDEKES